MSLSLLLLSLNIFANQSTASAPTPSSSTLKYEGRIWTDSIFVMDDFKSQTVIEIYENASCSNPGELQKVVFGKERESIASVCDSQCCIEKTLRGNKVVVERIISNADDSDAEITDKYKTGPSLISGVGLDFGMNSNKFGAKVHGNFSSSILDERTMYGHDRYRYYFTEAYGEYKSNKFQVRGGRQSPVAGVLTDGLDVNFFLGSEGYRESKKIGLFGGLSPNPISKKPSHERMAVGLYGTYIPEFSSKSDTKLRTDSGLIGELYKNKLNRFYLYNRTHFTPIRELSLLGHFTFDLPAPSGDDKGFSVNYASLSSYWRPDLRWFASLGFTQFKIDRFLREESVRWLTDEGSQQSDRLGDTLDRSYRYRVDARVSFKPFYFLQPFLKGRYERRTFDENKKGLNQAPGATGSAVDNVVLLNKKNAYRVEAGTRVFPIASVETETSFIFNQRFQSKAYEAYQAVIWQVSKPFSLDAYGQAVWSQRLILNSVASGQSRKSKSTDYYAGLGASYKFVTDLMGQIRYDFSCEDDPSLATNILSHSAWARLEYKF